MDFRLYVSTLVSFGGKVLLVQEQKEKYHGKWNLPGGHLEIGETTLEGALRELKEETGLVVDVQSTLGVYYNVHSDHTSFRFVYFGKSDIDTVIAGDNIMDSKWFSPEEIEQMSDNEFVSVQQFREIIEDYKKGVTYPVKIFHSMKV